MAFFGANLDNFLDNFWQTEPYQLSGVIPDAEQLISADEVVYAASSEQTESTLLLMPEGRQWDLVLGPFDPEQIENLTEPYNLSVRGLEKMMPELATISEQLPFVPDWGREELAFSYSAFESARGPFFNESDAFFFNIGPSLSFEYARVPRPEFINYLPVGVVANFELTRKVQLGPGDLFYLPPGYSYRYEGLLCMGLSSHAPLRSELLSDWLSACPTDPRLQVKPRLHQGARLGREEVERAREFLRDAMTDPEFATWYGRYLTATDSKLVEPLDEPVTVRQFKAELNHAECLYRSPNVRWAYHDADEPTLFVGGRAFPTTLELAQKLAEQATIESLAVRGQETLLCELYNLGYVDFFPLQAP